MSQVVDAEAHAEAVVGPVEDTGHACTGSAARRRINRLAKKKTHSIKLNLLFFPSDLKKTGKNLFCKKLKIFFRFHIQGLASMAKYRGLCGPL